MHFLPTSNLLLKHQPELFKRILNKELTPLQIVELTLLALVGLAVFGAVMSIHFPHWWHALNLMWKMIVLIIGSDLLCLPALYVFSSIRGSRITLLQLVLFLSASITTTAVVLLSLSPIAWFFTWSTNGNIDTIRVMNTLMIGFGIIFGIILLMRAFQAGYKHYKEQYPDNKSAADILLLWLLLVIVVTVQMGQKLGPWYSPDEPRGQFTEQPTLRQTDDGMLVVNWQIPEAFCEQNQVIYTVGGGEGNWPAECKDNLNGQYNCQATISEVKDDPVGTYYDLHTVNTDCGNAEVWNQAEHNYKSQILGYSKY